MNFPSFIFVFERKNGIEFELKHKYLYRIWDLEFNLNGLKIKETLLEAFLIICYLIRPFHYLVHNQKVF